MTGIVARDRLGRRFAADAQVVVEEVAGNPGYYTSKFFLRPHYQLEGLTVSLRLVSKLPSAKARSEQALLAGVAQFFSNLAANSASVQLPTVPMS